MKIIFQALKAMVAIGLLAVSNYALAIPTLFFDGDMSYNSSMSELSVMAVLDATEDITPPPELVGSSLTFSALLTGVDVSSSIITVGVFSGTSGDDITVTDGNSNDLLFGEFLSLSMAGRNGRDSGRITGTINATGGSLESYFGEGQLIALEFNITTTFSADMFNNSFLGNVDGRIEGETQTVPAPGGLVLLGFGSILIGVRKIHARYI